jgi:hypothetical protein
MPTVSDPTIAPAALELLTALQVELAKVPSGAPTHYRIVPGLAAVLSLDNFVDECCEGVAWIRLVNVYPTLDFPTQDSDFLPEEPVSYAAVFEVGVARCGGGPGPDGHPSDAEYNADSARLMDDAAALRRIGATLKATSTHIIDYRYGPGAWEPIAAEGGCMGGVLHMTIQVHNCDSQMAG